MLITPQKLMTGKRSPVFNAVLPGAPALISKSIAPFSMPNQTTWRNSIASVDLLGNDKAGCCAFATSGHFIQAVTSAAGSPEIPSTDCILDSYASYTGYNQTTGEGDNGTVLLDKNTRWVRDGMAISDDSAFDKLDGFAPIDPGDLDTIRQALSIFGPCVELGVLLPENASAVYQEGNPWQDISEPGTEGHDTLIVDFIGEDWFVICTWYRLQMASSAWVKKYMDEGNALLRRSFLNGSGLSPTGLNMAQLDQHIGEMRGVLGIGAL